MGKLSEKAKFIDLYASRPVLSFGKDGKVYSRLGLLLTFLTVIIIGGMAVWIGINIFGRRKPSFIQYDLPPKVLNPIIPWNTDDFKFGLSLLLSDDDEDFLVNYYPTYEGAIDGKIKKIPMNMNRECRFGISSNRNFKCFYQDEETKGKTYLDAKGSWKYVIQYDKCYSNTPAGCWTETDPKSYLKSTPANLVYNDLVIDPFSYENPLINMETVTTAPVFLDVGTTLVVELNEVEFISDNGWIFEDLKSETKLKPSTSIKVSTEPMLAVQIVYGGGKTVYKRTYPKIQDFFAQVSGFITIITPIFLILVAPYGNLQAVQHMTNEIYEIKLNKSDKGGSPQRSSSSAKKKTHSSKSQSSPKGTQGDLLPQKAKTKAKSKTTPPSNPSRKSIPFAPHAALVIGGVGKLPTREDTPPIPDENTTPFNFEAFDKSPSSPFKLNSITSRHGDESNLISPQKSLFESAKTCPPKPEDGKLDENLEPKKETETQNPVEESESESESEEEEEEIPLRTSDPLEVPWQGWIKSFWKPSPEVQVLNKAKEHIMETFDLVTLSKKVIEIEKLKACLLTHDQRVIFENLPSSVIVLNPEIDLKSPEAIKQYHWKDSFKGDEIALRKAYSRLKATKNELDKLLIRLYESEYIDDGFRQEN